MTSTLQRKPEGIRSGRNPIEDFLNDVIQEDTEANVQDTWKTYWQRLVLEDCGFDLAKVEAKLREYKGGGIAKARRPFRELRRGPPLVKREAAGSREMMTFQINFPKRML